MVAGLSLSYTRRCIKNNAKTSRHDSYTGEEIPTNNWGYGKIDAYEGIKECIQQASEIKPTVINNPHMIIFNGKQLKVVPGFMIQTYVCNYIIFKEYA